jgi:LPS export ABC transporter protein LptC
MSQLNYLPDMHAVKFSLKWGHLQQSPLKGIYFYHMLLFRITPLILIASLVFAGCSKKNEPPPRSDETVFVPYQEFGKSTMFFYEGNNKQAILVTEYMRKTLVDTAKTLAVPVDLTTYDSTGTQISHILADSGLIAPSNQYFKGWGNVWVKRSDNLVIKSQSLWWDRTTKKVGSDDYVEIKTPSGDIMRGKGLDAAESFSNWKLRESVSGSFPRFRERMEGGDKEM